MHMEENGFFGPPWGQGPMFDPQWNKMQMFQARRGDMRGIILQSLKKRPMHGYEVIRSLEKASHGMWRPSPGSIYPTLQMLEEQELVEAREENGKKIYSLTASGKKEAATVDTDEPWTRTPNFERKKQYRKLIGETMHAFRTIIHSNDAKMITQADSILQTAHDKMVALTQQIEK